MLTAILSTTCLSCSSVPTHLVSSEAGRKAPEVGSRQEVVEGGEQELPRCRGRDPLTGGVGTCHICQAELRGLFRGPEHLETEKVGIGQL